MINNSNLTQHADAVKPDHKLFSMLPSLEHHLTMTCRWHTVQTSLVLVLRNTHTCLTALFPGLPGWAGSRKVKPICILLKQETVSGSGISWAACKSAPRSRQIATPAPHHSVFYRPDALPAAQPTASKHCSISYRDDNMTDFVISSERANKHYIFKSLYNWNHSS